MKAETPILSEAFQRLYCDASVFEDFSAWHSIRFTRVLPFQASDPVVDDAGLLAAEVAHLAQPNAATRLAVLEAFGQCGLLSVEDVAHMQSALDDFGADFFEFMGETYANAGMFICALRWYREWIAFLETQTPTTRSDVEDVYASAGYCLHSLGLYPEAIAWTKSCIGPDLMADIVGAVLTDFQARLAGGRLLAVERAMNRTRYTASTRAADFSNQCTPQLRAALKNFIPFQEPYLDWIDAEAPAPQMPAEGYPFRLVVDNNSLPRHKMNLLFALVAQADALCSRGSQAEARRLLQEAAMLEPRAEFVQQKLTVLP